jgi:hypothetical protein
MGVVFLASGIGKLIDSEDAKYLVELLSMEIYWLIEYKQLIVGFITVFEILLAGLFLSGFWLKKAFAGAVTLLVALTSMLVYFQLQDVDVASCGCFGAFDILSGPIATITKNVVLLIVSGVAIWLLSKNREQIQTPD